MNLLGIDFEDWYHPQLVQPFVKNLKHEPKMYQGIEKIIDLLRKTETTATFFMVGELLEKNPSMIDLIIENDHEIGFHTMTHSNLNNLTKEKFLEELDSFYILTNGKSNGFRAPTFSINSRTSWAIDALIDAGAIGIQIGNGFGPSASKDQTNHVSKIVKNRCSIKTVGGIKTFDQAIEMIEAGSTYIGTSFGFEITQEQKKKE